jgi:cation/acetate symporter
VVTYLVAAGGLAAALSTADGLLLTISNALSHDLFFRMVRPGASPIKRVMLSKLMVLVTAVLAAWVASLRITNILPFVAAAFSLAAATFFPALVMGIFWRRANRAGAVAGMVTGAAVCLWYMAHNLPGLRDLLGVTGDARWWGIEPVAAGVFGVPAGCLALLVVSRLTAPPGPEERVMAEALRLPGGTGQSRSGPPSQL